MKERPVTFTCLATVMVCIPPPLDRKGKGKAKGNAKSRSCCAGLQFPASLDQCACVNLSGGEGECKPWCNNSFHKGKSGKMVTYE